MGCIDAGIAYLHNEAMPALRDMSGWIGLSLLVDRETGRCIMTSAWDSEDAMLASAESAAPQRNQAVQMFGGPSYVENWEIAVLHREHNSAPGACVRATWLTMAPDLLDAGVEYFRGIALPQLEHLPGFRSASLMIDRLGGRGVASVSFANKDVMADNRNQAAALKVESIRSAGASEVDEGEFELAIAHLRVPELV
ncbi:MAG: hypothetical protein P4L86_00155 [Mycobacterium sp.]|nr:hypothetical protein [Mycobacterium sp.]